MAHKRVNLDDLPKVQLDTTDESADWIKMSRLPYCDDGMTLQQFRARLAEYSIDVERFKATVGYKAALERGEPDWIDQL